MLLRQQTKCLTMNHPEYEIKVAINPSTLFWCELLSFEKSAVQMSISWNYLAVFTAPKNSLIAETVTYLLRIVPRPRYRDHHVEGRMVDSLASKAHIYICFLLIDKTGCLLWGCDFFNKILQLSLKYIFAAFSSVSKASCSFIILKKTQGSVSKTLRFIPKLWWCLPHIQPNGCQIM